LGYRLRKLVRRHKGPGLAAALVLLALGGGIIGTTWGLIRATLAQAGAGSEADQKQAPPAAAPQSERHAKGHWFPALPNRGPAGRFSRQPGQRLDSLAALAEAALIRADECTGDARLLRRPLDDALIARTRPDDRLRDEAIAALALSDVRRVPGWHSTPPGT